MNWTSTGTSNSTGEVEAMGIAIPLITIAGAVLSAALPSALAADDPYHQKRAAMVRDQIEAEGVSDRRVRSEEHTSELQSLMRISYAVFCLQKKKKNTNC